MAFRAMVGATPTMPMCSPARPPHLAHRRRRGHPPHRPPSRDGRPSAAKQASSAPSQEEAIFDLSFTIESRYRPFELVADEVGSTDAPTTELQLADRCRRRRSAQSRPRSPGPREGFCWGWPSRTVTTSSVGTTPTPAGWGSTSARGVSARTIRRRKVDIPGTLRRLGVALCENRLTVLAESGDSSEPLLTERNKIRALVDMRDAGEELGRRRLRLRVWPGLGPAPHRRAVGAVRDDGIRDQHLVQHSDGTPYLRDGKAYFTGTCAGLGFFQQAHWGVFTLDLAQPKRLEQVSPDLLPARRSPAGRPRGPDRPRREAGPVDHGQQGVGRLRLQRPARASPGHHR